jgi:hypothetical protein
VKLNKVLDCELTISQQLLQKDEVSQVRALCRTPSILPEEIRASPKFKALQVKDIAKVKEIEMMEYIQGCDAVLLCLGHTLNFKGVFLSGLIVKNANVLICNSIEKLQPTQKIKFIQVNTIGVDSPDGKDKNNRGLGNNLMFKLIGLVPPFWDSKCAAKYVYSLGKESKHLEWCCVRPDGLLDNPVAPYTLYETIPWSIFAAQTTNRASCADFMCRLALDPVLWEEWKGKFPIVLNKT